MEKWTANAKNELSIHICSSLRMVVDCRDDFRFGFFC